MQSTRVQVQPFAAAGVLILGLAVLSAALNAASTVWLMTFTIDEDPSFAVHADNPAQPYKDYRLGTGLPSDVNYCVEASPTANLLFISLNRTLDGGSGTLDCGLHGGTPRQFVVNIDDASACDELYSHGYPTGPTAPCQVTDVDKPRIRISSDLYAKQTSTTPVAFLTKWYDVSRTSYEIRTETNATVIKNDLNPSMRIVRYSGLARLWRFDAGVQAQAVAQPFALPFQMTFTRTAQ